MTVITQDRLDRKHPLDKEEVVKTTPKGTDFYVKQDNSGLFVIYMNKAGGKLPSICSEKFTSSKAAETALEVYLIEKTR